MTYPSEFTVGTRKFDGIPTAVEILDITGMNPPRLSPYTMMRVAKLGLPDRDLERFFDVALRAAFSEGMEYVYAEVDAVYEDPMEYAEVACPPPSQKTVFGRFVQYCKGLFPNAIRPQ